MIVMCDIDGTVADNSHRQHFVDKAKRHWNYFYHSVNLQKDKPIQAAVQAIPDLVKRSTQFHFLTGRPERTRLDTTNWIYDHFRLVLSNPAVCRPDQGHLLYMREDGNHARAVVFKEMIIQKFMNESGCSTDTILFLDDDERNFDMYMKYGDYLEAPTCWELLRILEIV